MIANVPKMMIFNTWYVDRGHIIKHLNYEADDDCNKPSHDSTNTICEINTGNTTDNNVQSDLFYDINVIQQGNFVCDNNKYYLKNTNTNSIQAIVATII